jgi:hypothetical protein
MDLWATLGISPWASIGLVVAGLVAAAGVAGRLLRRSHKARWVQVDLTDRR